MRIWFLIGLTGFEPKTKPMLSILVFFFKKCMFVSCLPCFDSLMTSEGLKVRMGRSGPFYTGTSCLSFWSCNLFYCSYFHLGIFRNKNNREWA